MSRNFALCVAGGAFGLWSWMAAAGGGLARAEARATTAKAGTGKPGAAASSAGAGAGAGPGAAAGAQEGTKLPWPAWVDPYARVELGVGLPLGAPQTDFFGPGFAGRLALGVGLGEWVGVEVAGQQVILPGRSGGPAAGDVAAPFGVGAGVRVKLPYAYAVYPFVDATLLYVRSGSLDRFGYTVGAGVHVPVGEARIVRLGPFVRFYQVTDSDAPNVNSADAKMLLIGASIEAGFPHPRAVPSQDRDDDGVTDPHDRCPDIAGPVETRGCPDRDGDLVGDPDDACPDVAGSARTGGCPDRDRDGLSDKDDRCPDRPGPASVGGCPDRDGDGVADDLDRCPDRTGPAATAGCPDRDGDLVSDEEDLCPDLRGVPEHKGCPAPRAALTATGIEINEKIYFESGSADILPRSFGILDQVALLLIDNDKLRVRVEGHTDNQRSERFDNLKLSQLRADAVRDYLVAHGVATGHLRTRGYGDEKPIAPNDNDEGREKNRRVEFVITR